MSVRFVNAWMLYLIWLAPAAAACWAVFQRRRESRLESFVSPVMQRKLRPAGAGSRYAWQTGLTAAGALLLLLAAARPQWGEKEETVYRRGRDLMIVLDVSRSMLAEDVHPNRLQRAKADIMDLIKELRGDRAGLMVFRRTANLLCPLTTDYAYLKQALDGAGIDSAPRGATDIGGAIETALEHFDRQEGSHKAVILISDGEDLSGRALKSAEKSAEMGIPIFTVGLGDRRGSRIPDTDSPGGYTRYRGNDVISSLDNETLYEIARKTGAAYVPVETAGMTEVTLGTLYRDHLRKIAVRDMEESLQRRYVERYQLFLLPGLVCLLAGAFLSRGRLAAGAQRTAVPRGRSGQHPGATGATGLKDITPPARKPKHIMALILLLALPAGAGVANTNDAAMAPTNAPAGVRDVPPGRSGARIAQHLYLLGRYEEAAAAYLEAAKGSAGKSRRDFRYNAAAALFNAGKHKEAADILRDLEWERADRSGRTAMGLGSVLFKAAEDLPEGIEDHEKAAERERLLRQSGEAFRNAARKAEPSETVERNLAVAERAWREAAEQARIAELNHRYLNTPPEELAAEMLKNQRDINDAMRTVFTNEAPSRIREMEALADKQRETAGMWVPLKGKLLEAMSQKADDPEYRQKLAQFETVVEATRDNMLNAAHRLEDLDPYAREAADTSQAAVYNFWKSIAGFPGLLREDLRLQTNVIDMTTAPDSDEIELPVVRQSQQDEAGELTMLFTERFTESVPEEGLPAAAAEQSRVSEDAGEDAAVKKPLISSQDRRKILDLAGQAMSAQESASALLREDRMDKAVVEQREAYRLLKEIEKLLPTDKQPGQQQQEQQEQKEEQSQPQQDQKQEDAGEREQQPPPEQEQTAEEQQKPAEQEREEEATPEDVRALLEKALQREKEHEAEVRRRRRDIPMGPIDKDW